VIDEAAKIEKSTLRKLLRLILESAPMGYNYKSDRELREKANEFFRAARDSVWEDKSSLRELFEKGSYQHLNGIFFEVNEKVREAQNQLVARCIKLLGPKLGNEKEIVDLAWKHVCQSLAEISPSSDIPAIEKEFLDDLFRDAKRDFVYLVPNYIIGFREHVQEIKIGPVRAILSNDLLLSEMQNLKNIVQVGSEFKFSFEGINSNSLIQIPPTCWYISVNAARGNAAEEAIWLINVAVSLLRLSYPHREYLDFPSFGDAEPMPTTDLKVEEQGVLLNPEGGISINASRPHFYVVDDAISAITKEQEFKDRAQAIFFSDEKPLAKRFSQGLGWLTRGRQTIDRAERFLFFFTAIESLLSSNDSSAPVVQTIARYAATILSPNAGKREKIAKEVKSLYGARSALVHAGKRGVSQSESNAAQYLAELLYITVMESVPLTVPFDKFQASLSEASYGLPWPQSKPSSPPSQPNASE